MAVYRYFKACRWLEFIIFRWHRLLRLLDEGQHFTWICYSRVARRLYRGCAYLWLSLVAELAYCVDSWSLNGILAGGISVDEVCSSFLGWSSREHVSCVLELNGCRRHELVARCVLRWVVCGYKVAPISRASMELVGRWYLKADRWPCFYETLSVRKAKITWDCIVKHVQLSGWCIVVVESFAVVFWTLWLGYDLLLSWAKHDAVVYSCNVSSWVFSWRGVAACSFGLVERMMVVNVSHMMVMVMYVFYFVMVMHHSVLKVLNRHWRFIIFLVTRMSTSWRKIQFWFCRVQLVFDIKRFDFLLRCRWYFSGMYAFPWPG